jgi:hypothetical protein
LLVQWTYSERALFELHGEAGLAVGAPGRHLDGGGFLFKPHR